MRRFGIVLATAIFISACSDKSQSPTENSNVLARSYDYAQLQRGEKLFRANCAKCHGQDAEGTKEWQKLGADGNYPPPPLNGTAHAWHHPTSVLLDVIKNGTARMGGNMPAWKDKLSDDEIRDIIVWFQAKWPDEVYKAWYEMEQRAITADKQKK